LNGDWKILGHIVLLAIQYVDFARRLADYVYVMGKGSIVLASKGQQLSEGDVKRSRAF
jgi:ABC-type branched-subunit amino acid transport system ATPase component